jgi:cytochrome c1
LAATAAPGSGRAGTPAAARAGPDLSHLANRQTLGSGVLDNTPENLRKWLADPQAVKPGNRMPSLRLTEAELRALVAYLETLQ